MNQSLALDVPATLGTETPLALSASRPKLNALTTLRFLAALQVVLFHMRVTGILAGGPWWYQNFAASDTSE